MASTIWKICNTNINTKIAPGIYQSIRNGHHLRGKPPGIARNLEQRLEEINYKNPELHFKVDIGLPLAKTSRDKEFDKRLEIMKSKRKDQALERKARNKDLLIDLPDVRREWLKSVGASQIRRIAEHYGIFNDLFGDAYFHACVPLDITYEINDGSVPVFYGNVVSPTEASKMPKIRYESDANALWTLIMTNPDGHFTEQNKEYVHWFVGNIPGNQIGKGEAVFDYLQPFPAKGTGYQRHVFILYKQEKKIDFSQLKRSGPCLSLADRTFSTLEFYKDRQDEITPAGLAFYQSDWDESLTDFFHNSLNMKEPVFEYDFPEPYVKPQEWFPLREAFNLYMDRYRDPKQINKEFLMRKLKNVHPFKPAPQPLPFPNAVHFEGYVPSWLKLQKTKSRNKQGRINCIE